MIRLRDFMERDEGWGRAQGREVYVKLIGFIENHPGILVFKISLEGVQKFDMSFASETIVEAARRYRGKKGFCIIDPNNPEPPKDPKLKLVLFIAQLLRVIGRLLH